MNLVLQSLGGVKDLGPDIDIRLAYIVGPLLRESFFRGKNDVKRAFSTLPLLGTPTAQSQTDQKYIIVFMAYYHLAANRNHLPASRLFSRTPSPLAYMRPKMD